MAHSTSWEEGDAGKNFADTLTFLINHRGYLAEKQLVETFSLSRVSDLLDGKEPTFREVAVVAKVLGVPLSIFQFSRKESVPELEIAFAEILYESTSMSKKERETLASKMLKLIHPDSSDVINILQFQKRK